MTVSRHSLQPASLILHFWLFPDPGNFEERTLFERGILHKHFTAQRTDDNIFSHYVNNGNRMTHRLDAICIDLIKLVEVANNAVQLLGEALALIVGQAEPGQLGDMLYVSDGYHLFAAICLGATQSEYYVRHWDRSSGILAERPTGVNCDH